MLGSPNREQLSISSWRRRPQHRAPGRSNSHVAKSPAGHSRCMCSVTKPGQVNALLPAMRRCTLRKLYCRWHQNFLTYDIWQHDINGLRWTAAQALHMHEREGCTIAAVSL